MGVLCNQCVLIRNTKYNAMSSIKWVWFLLLIMATGLSCESNGQSSDEEQLSLAERIELAANYSDRHEGDAFLVMKDGNSIFEEYQNGYQSSQLHMLASGSKSFSCAIAVAAISDGFLEFEEEVGNVITEWKSDSVKSTITYRQLLNLTSGLPPGESPLRGGRPASETRTSDAISADFIFEPGTDFIYGQYNYQVFTEAIHRKLIELGMNEDPADYLERKVLNPIGYTNLVWIRDFDGLPYLAGGGFSTAQDWIKYGELILNNGNWRGNQILESGLLEECFVPEDINGAYGLTFWMNSDALVYLSRENGINLPFPEKRYNIPMAAGAYNQRMYIIEEENMVVVRFGRQDNTWSDAELLSLFIDGEEYNAPVY